MGTTYETGHERNTDGLAQIKSHCEKLGSAYNPSNPTIKMEAINLTLTNARDANRNVAEKLNRYAEAVDEREIIFQDLSPFTTRLYLALQSSNVTDQKLDDARSIIRKIKGQRAVAIDTNPKPETEITETTETPTTKRSVSQLSYTNRLANYSKLVDLYVYEPKFAPNEEELKPAALQERVVRMQEKNDQVIYAATNLKDARIKRDKILYAKDTGLCDVAAGIKAYIGSLLGTNSPEYKAVAKIKFSKKK